MDFIDDLIELQEIEEYLGYIDYTVRKRPYHQEFFHRFRLSKPTVQMLLERIEGQLQHRTNRNHAIVTLRQDYIRLPRGEEFLHANQQFYNIARFPRVFGALDCTQIRIQNLGGEIGENFRNRKGFFSLNVVCNAKCEITDVVARWPGARHDSNIFDNSAIRMRFEASEMGRNLLLGDGGYPVRPYLITPLSNCQTPAERLFNRCQIRTRNVIERTFGILKRRFPILSMGMRCRLPLCQDIIVATAILHNIAFLRNEDLPEPMDNIVEEGNDIHDNIINENDAVRRELIDYFAGLL